MKNTILIAAMLLATSTANAVVFINEVFINPAGSFDSSREFVELMGTPGKKLDGYAVAFVNGVEQKYYPLGSIPPVPAAQEIDEFFSLDGLELGKNGLLVIGIDYEVSYPSMLDDSNFACWENIWNGGLDTPGKLQNDGSNTILLIRNRPGKTEADPSNPLGVLWGKDVAMDTELITPVVDPQDGVSKDQYGDGNIDKGDPNGMGGFTRDCKGASTPADVTDDLEVVDELSYEHERGWEYDMDGRHVDDGSTFDGLPYRHVHALDDPQGLNPDVLSRVDYRTKGAGWTPAPGALGEMPNGNNWQDTATEQWIRGESLYSLSGGAGEPPYFFYDNAANTNPDAIQPYATQVPLWLDDDQGDDFDFTTGKSYQIMAGRINPLAVPFIPGDVDRDGDCDTEDINLVLSVFGDDNWIFSNSFTDAPQGDEGDPATQVRPWNVDGTGDNGIETADLQWVLNFQGSTDGRIVGLRYDDTTPSATGVYLNSNDSVTCAVTAAAGTDTVSVGETVEIAVYGEVTGGDNLIAGQENGISQFVHDLTISPAGILTVDSIEAVSPFKIGRSSVQVLNGTDGDLGVSTVNGYTTSYTAGLSVAMPLYRVTLRAVGSGNAAIGISSAAEEKFTLSAAGGLCVAHTVDNGEPFAVTYPASLSIQVAMLGDIDGDNDIDYDDNEAFVDCLTGPENAASSECVPADLDNDGDVDLADWQVFQDAFAL